MCVINNNYYSITRYDAESVTRVRRIIRIVQICGVRMVSLGGGVSRSSYVRYPAVCATIVIGAGDDSVDAGIFGRGARNQDSGRFMTVCSVVNFIMGSGILNTPQSFSDSGIAATTVLYFLACKSGVHNKSITVYSSSASNAQIEYLFSLYPPPVPPRPHTPCAP